MRGRRHAGRSPTSVTSCPRSWSAVASARACASEPPMLESSFFAMTMRTRGALGQRLVRARLGAERERVGGLDAVHDAVPIPPFGELRGAGETHRGAQRGVVEQAEDRGGDVAPAPAHEETVG